MTMEQFLALVVVGLGIGIFGTLIGAGGGFILMPLLLIVYPQENPELLTSISLAVVFFNALSGTVAYARMKRIDYRSGILFSLATVPGAILGALSTSYIPRRTFNVIFGLALISASLFLFLNPRRRGEAEWRGVRQCGGRPWGSGAGTGCGRGSPGDSSTPAIPCWRT